MTAQLTRLLMQTAVLSSDLPKATSSSRVHLAPSPIINVAGHA
jgi:hypothetical protein